MASKYWVKLAQGGMFKEAFPIGEGPLGLGIDDWL